MKTTVKWDLRWVFGGVLVLAVVALLVLVLVPRLRGPEPVATPAYWWPTQGWRNSTPEEQGIDSAKLAEALLTIREQNINIHSLMLIRNGLVVTDATFYPYDGKDGHDVASVTKSLMTTLIAMAADQGKLQLDQPMLSFFPNRAIANRDARKERITVRHLANMASGLDCTKERDEATLKEMWTTDDWVQFVLDRQVKWEPGTQFVYCSPGSHLLSAILQQATGMTALEFARQNLFEPLGIRDVIWPADPQGVTRGWGDIRLLTRHGQARLPVAQPGCMGRPADCFQPVGGRLGQAADQDGWGHRLRLRLVGIDGPQGGGPQLVPCRRAWRAVRHRGPVA